MNQDDKNISASNVALVAMKWVMWRLSLESRPESSVHAETRRRGGVEVVNDSVQSIFKGWDARKKSCRLSPALSAT